MEVQHVYIKYELLRAVLGTTEMFPAAAYTRGPLKGFFITSLEFNPKTN